MSQNGRPEGEYRSAQHEGSPLTFRRLSDIDVRGKRVFIRADLNVPQDDAGAITDDTRIRASVPGIRDALARGAAVMVTSHLGRPTEGAVERRRTRSRRSRSGSPSCSAATVPLVRDWVDGGAWHDALKPGELVLLENCRINKGEKKDDDALARKMAKLCDVYVNDAFGTAHRAEATTHGIAKSRAGRLRRTADGGRTRCARQGARRIRRARWWRSSRAPRCRPSSRSCARSRRRSTR